MHDCIGKLQRDMRVALLAGALSLFAGSAFAKATVSTLASAGISADTFNGAPTALTGPTLDEGASQDIGAGTLMLNAPAGFQFDTTATVLVTVTKISGSGTVLTLASGTASVTAGSITITITAGDSGGKTRSRLTWSGIRVRPAAGSPLATGNLTSSGNAVLKGVSSSTSFGTLTETSGAVTALSFSTQPAGATSGAPFATQPVVVTQDQFGNNSTNGLAATNNVTIALVSGTGPLQGNATLNIAMAGGKGTAAYTGLRLDVAGSKQLQVSATGLASATSAAFTVVPGPASQLVLVTQPSSTAVAGVPFALQPVVWLEDAYGNLRTADTLTVTAARQAGAGTLQGTTSIAAIGGVVTFTNLAHPLATNITIVFSSGTLTTATSSTIAVAPGPFSKLQVLLPGQSPAPGTTTWKSGTPAAQTIGVGFNTRVTAVDANWNPIATNDTVKVTSTDPLAVLPGSTALVAGSLTLPVTMNTSGSQTLTAADLTFPGIGSGVSSTFTVSQPGTTTNGPVLPAQTNRTIYASTTLVVTNTATESGLTNSASGLTTNSFVFNYSSRTALLADGWNFIATTATGQPRNTEITNTANGAVISYDQTAHPGTLRIPCDVGDLWSTINSSRNSLFRNVPTNWVSMQLSLSFAPTLNTQQVHLGFYQDDDNYTQSGLAYNLSLGGEVSTLIWEVAANDNHFYAGLNGVTSIHLRLDQNPGNGNISGYYSLDGSAWNMLGTVSIVLNNPRLCIWVGGSPVPRTNGLPNCDLSRLDITVTNTGTPTFTYQLVNPPTGAAIDNNGIITWTPSSSQAPSTNLITTIVTDNRQLPLSATNSFTVFVLTPPLTNGPSLPLQNDLTITAGTALTVTNAATDTRMAVSAMVTNTTLFNYTNRTALLADGWNFLATTATGATRNTEITNTANGAVVSYDQTAHPGTLRIPCDVGDLWGSLNNTRNSIFRALPTNWLSLQLAIAFAPTLNTEQAHLTLYQDDDNYVQSGLAYNSGEKAAMDLEVAGSPSTTAFNSVALSSIHLRLDRTPGTANVTGLYSADGITWTTLSQVTRSFSNPRLGIWVGGSSVPWTNGLPNCGLQRLDITVTNQPVPVTLTYQLINPPAGASISNNGVITWTPTSAQAPSTNVFITVVTDNGQPPLSATNTFTVVVNPVTPAAVPMPIAAAQATVTLNYNATGNSVQLAFPGVPGQTYEVQWSPAVTGPWQMLTTVVADSSGQVRCQVPPPAPMAFFRVLAY